MLINLGLVGPKVKAKAAADGQQVNIPAHLDGRSSKTGSILFVISNPSGGEIMNGGENAALVSGRLRWNL